MACLARCLALFICCTTSLSSHFSRRSNLNELLLASAIEVLQLQKEQTKKNKRRFLIEVQLLISYCINNSFIENKESISKGAFTPRYSSSEWSVCAVFRRVRETQSSGKGVVRLAAHLELPWCYARVPICNVDGGYHYASHLLVCPLSCKRRKLRLHLRPNAKINNMNSSLIAPLIYIFQDNAS